VAVKEFLHDCGHYNIRCARIVHGKGHGSWQKQPILKVKLSRWLRQHDAVLAFCSARPTDGGTGAVYVLIKKRY
jgi:DNA-nicking Smr family endonuclease